MIRVAVHVLFVCLHNAGRSQMSQALFERAANGRHSAESAGSVADPGGRVHPGVIEVMREIGVDLSGRRPQPLTRELAERADVVVTMGCGDACPYIPGRRYLDWDLPDPKGQPVETCARRATRSPAGSMGCSPTWTSADGLAGAIIGVIILPPFVCPHHRPPQALARGAWRPGIPPDRARGLPRAQKRLQYFAPALTDQPGAITGFSSCSVPSSMFTLTNAASMEPVEADLPAAVHLRADADAEAGDVGLRLGEHRRRRPRGSLFWLSRPTAQPNPKPPSKHTAQPSSVWHTSRRRRRPGSRSHPRTTARGGRGGTRVAADVRVEVRLAAVVERGVAGRPAARTPCRGRESRSARARSPGHRARRRSRSAGRTPARTR